MTYRHLRSSGGPDALRGRVSRGNGQDPYPYQRVLAEAEQLPEVLVAPTGAGKTAAAILGWLYRRRFADHETRRATPRRLIFCLPMRTLVSQTCGAAVT